MHLPIKCLVIFLALFFFSFINVDNVLACDTTNFIKREIDYPNCALVDNCTPSVWNTTVTYRYRNQDPCSRVEYFSSSTCADGTQTTLGGGGYVCNTNRGCTVAGGECAGTGNSICVRADYNDTNSMCTGTQPTSTNRNSNVCKIINCGNYCDTTNYSCQIKYAQQGVNVGTSATNICQNTDPTGGGVYCAAPAPTAPPPAPAPAPAPAAPPPPPAGSCTFTDPARINHIPANGNDCVGISGSGTCPCNNTASFNYTDDGVTCNTYPNGVLTGAESYSFSGITCIPPPPPNCNSGLDCNDCSGAPANTCNTGNGTQSCTYATHSSGVTCTQVPAPSQPCTINNCSTNLRCEWGSCVRIGAWIQTTGGDVHSNTNIDLPGGP